MPGMLYLVPTPIGNLQDISPRMRQALEDADFIGAEDTRVTLKLLNHLGIKKPLLSYYDHNRAEAGQKILARLLDRPVRWSPMPAHRPSQIPARIWWHCVWRTESRSPRFQAPALPLLRFACRGFQPAGLLLRAFSPSTEKIDGNILPP